MPGRPAECCTTAVPVKARTRERMPRLRCSGRRRSPRARRRATRIAVCVVGLLLWGSVATAQEREAAGRIKIAAGSVFIVRANNTMPAKAGQDVYEADTLKTGADGSVGITLKDDTRLSLGPNSEIRLDRFAFVEAEPFGEPGVRPPGGDCVGEVANEHGVGHAAAFRGMIVVRRKRRAWPS